MENDYWRRDVGTRVQVTNPSTVLLSLYPTPGLLPYLATYGRCASSPQQPLILHSMCLKSKEKKSLANKPVNRYTVLVKRHLAHLTPPPPTSKILTVHCDEDEGGKKKV